MACAGNAAETCGGPNRLDLYSHGSGTSSPTSTKATTSASATPTSGWNFRGCYTDNVGGRALANGEPVPGGASSMTIEQCQTVCHGLGYTLAGLEYADECCMPSNSA